MSPPPLTPKPWRFLLPNRATPSSQAPFASSQFQSTPRFGSSSAVRQSERTKGPGEADDVIEEAEDDDEEDADDDYGEVYEGPRGDEGSQLIESSFEGEHRHLDNKQNASPIDLIQTSSLSSLSSSSSVEVLREVRLRHAQSPLAALPRDSKTAVVEGTARHATHTIEEREAKRRKLVREISVASSWAEEQHGTDEDEDLGPPSDVEAYDDEDVDDKEDSQQLSDDDAEAPLQQPVFRPPPRFKPLDADVAAAEGLPPAFSPQRRRGRGGAAPYVAGGQAAELQSWLSDMKSWEGAGTERNMEIGGERESPEAAMFSAAALVKLRVEQVRAGERMCVVRGRAEWKKDSGVRGAGDIAGTEMGMDMDADESCSHMILAGQGRLTGLGQSVDVGEGSIVTVRRPVWEVKMGGQRWVVACDWSVEG